MSYSLNFTGRTKLKNIDIEIQIRENKQNHVECKFVFSPEFQKKLESTYTNEILHICNCQTVGYFQAYKKFSISEIPKDWFLFEELENHFTLISTGGFTVEILNEKGLILAQITKIVPKTIVDGLIVSNRSFLAIHQADDLGDKVWALNFEGDSPVLILNKKYLLHEKISVQPYKSLILGPVVKEMLFYGVFVECFDLHNPNVEWFRKCLSVVLASNIQDIKHPSLQDEKEKMDYINQICDVFMERSKLNEDFRGSLFLDE